MIGRFFSRRKREAALTARIRELESENRRLREERKPHPPEEDAESVTTPMGTAHQERFRTLFETAGDGILLMDGEIFQDCNPATLRLFGCLDKGDILGRPPWDFSPEIQPDGQDSRRKARALIEKTLAGVPQHFEWQHRRLDHRCFHAEVTLSAHTREGRPWVQAIVRDVTGRKEMVRALRESEARLRRLVENLPVMLDALDEEGNILFWNRESERVTGYSAGEISGNPSAMRWLYPDAEYRERMFAELKGLGFDFRNREYTLTCKDGSRRTISWSNHSGTVAIPGWHTWAVGVDVTERVRAEAALRRSEKQKEMILEATAEAVVCLDTDLRVIWANRTAAELAGKTPEALAGRACGQIWRSCDGAAADACGCANSDVLAKRTPRTREIRTPDGRYWKLRGYPVLDEAGELVATVEFGRDVTERKAAKAEKERLEAQFHQAQKLESIGRLAGGIAHDLNNLLSPILAYSEMLGLQVSESDGRWESLNQIHAAGLRARDLVRQLLTFSRKQPLNREAVDLNQLLRNFEKLLRRTIREDVDIRWILGPDIPKVKGDFGLLEQVVMNLAVNAQDAMPDGGMLRIETRAMMLGEYFTASRPDLRPGPHVLLEVGDTGTGMDAETRAHLFEPFFSTKKEGEGTGLGLATVYGIVKQHNGHISVYGEPGKGTIFKVFFPAAPASGPEAVAATEPPPESALAGTETVLLVEDDGIVRELAEAILEEKGYTVWTAGRAEDALERLEGHMGPIHLLLTDVILPGMNGKELFHRVSRLYPEARVLYMSGYTDDIIAHHGVLEPGVAFIQKPFSVRTLAEKVRMVLDTGVPPHSL